MPLMLPRPFHNQRPPRLTILLAALHPDPQVLSILAQQPDLVLREAFSIRGLKQALSDAQLVILDELLPDEDGGDAIIRSALARSGLPVVSQPDFLTQPEEWLGRARLADNARLSFLPTRQVLLTNWAGGVGKTTLALAIARRFSQRAGLPAALLELSLGGSALQAKVGSAAADFFTLATGKSEPALWQGVSLYPMDGRSFNVLWSEDPGSVRTFLDDIAHRHTLLVIDAYPAHPLFAAMSQPRPGCVSLVVADPREDSLAQARQLLADLGEGAHLVLNRSRALSDRAESRLAAVLPERGSWAAAYDRRLADPLLELVYPGWRRKGHLTA